MAVEKSQEFQKLAEQWDRFGNIFHQCRTAQSCDGNVDNRAQGTAAAAEKPKKLFQGSTTPHGAGLGRLAATVVKQISAFLCLSLIRWAGGEVGGGSLEQPFLSLASIVGGAHWGSAGSNGALAASSPLWTL